MRTTYSCKFKKGYNSKFPEVYQIKIHLKKASQWLKYDNNKVEDISLGINNVNNNINNYNINNYNKKQ